MKRSSVETAVGVFVVVGFACFAFIAIKLGNLEIMKTNNYSLTARFDTVTGLRLGAPVEIAGVKVGTVDNVHLDEKKFEAVLEMRIEPYIKLPKDTIASVRTAGILGDKFIKLTPGADTEHLADGDVIVDTESALSLEELISKYMFEKK